MKFRFLEDIATADIAFKAYGKTLEELFENSALALFETMTDTKTVKPLRESHFALRTSDSEDLLFDFLSELIFLKDQKGMVFSKFKVKIEPDSLEANLWGEKIDLKRHNLKVDVKAVTRHQFEIKKERGKFIARVVLDI